MKTTKKQLAKSKNANPQLNKNSNKYWALLFQHITSTFNITDCSDDFASQKSMEALAAKKSNKKRKYVAVKIDKNMFKEYRDMVKSCPNEFNWISITDGEEDGWYKKTIKANPEVFSNFKFKRSLESAADQLSYCQEYFVGGYFASCVDDKIYNSLIKRGINTNSQLLEYCLNDKKMKTEFVEYVFELMRLTLFAQGAIKEIKDGFKRFVGHKNL